MARDARDQDPPPKGAAKDAGPDRRKHPPEGVSGANYVTGMGRPGFAPGRAAGPPAGPATGGKPKNAEPAKSSRRDGN